MKQIVLSVVDHLRIYPEDRTVESAVNKVKGTRAGALVLTDFLPASTGQEPTNVLQLSQKQILNLASMHGNAIRTQGREAMCDLATYVDIQKSVASVTCEEHIAGDEYVDTEGKTQKYTKTTTHYTVNSLALPDSIKNDVIKATIKKNMEYKSTDSLVSKLIGASATPALEGVK